MQTPRVMVVADLDYAGSTGRLLDVIERLAPVAGDPRVAIQVRAKPLDEPSLDALARAATERVPGDAALVLNGSATIAARYGYPGVHWPEHRVPAERPATVPWQSAAAHSLDRLRHAEEGGMDAVVFGAVFAPRSHPGDSAGLAALQRVTAAAQVPVIAIGGVSPERVTACVDAGAHGIAVVSDVLDAADPAAAVHEFLDAIECTSEGRQD